MQSEKQEGLVAPHVKARQASANQRTSGQVKLAAEAYIFGYPLVLMDATRRLMTAVTKPNGSRAPMNHFAHRREFPDTKLTGVVSPNADTLYSVAWLDLAPEPIVLSLPPMADRYYVMQLLDAWTNVFASLGQRTTGSAGGNVAIVGPWWSGTLPPDVKEVRAPTNLVWVIGRTETHGKHDYPAVRAVQDRYRLTGLSSWGTETVELGNVHLHPTDTEATPVEQVARMDAASFFDRLNVLMAGNPPSVADAEAMARFASIGIAPGQTFAVHGEETALDGGASAARDRLIAAAGRQFGERVNGWEIPPRTIGRYGTDYLLRAVVALIGLGANLPEDAMYPHTTRDADGQSLTGANKYVVRFPKRSLPPVRGFWSITMYNGQQQFTDNVIDRYAIGDRDNLTFGNDGSLTLYIQHDSPGIAHTSNWLPAPAGPFNLIMRLYWPAMSVLDGVWKPPAVERIDDGGSLGMTPGIT
jgi:hypothetical protein